MRSLNRTYRKKDVPTDILSFPLSKKSGQIVLCLPEVKTHAAAFDMSAAAYLPYLVIHGLVHLKGHEHGRIMDTWEQRYCRRFNLKKPDGTAHRSRH